MRINEIPEKTLTSFKNGIVIPAMPLALDENRRFDAKYQKALLRYYIDAGAGGLAVGVHSTQFEIRRPNISLFEPLLEFASKTIDEYCAYKNKDSFIKIAGVCGKTDQAKKETEIAMEQGYHAILLSLTDFKECSISEMINHCRKIADLMPIVGFYLQPSVGGRALSYEFWKEFCSIDNILGIKIAPFNRYQTLEVVRAVCCADKHKQITLYTGNDDNIVIDLLTEYQIKCKDEVRSIRIKGGLLGHWAVWTKKAVELLERIHRITKNNTAIPAEFLTLAQYITDCNSVFFDSSNNFSGCIPGIHEILRRQGLLKGIWCLDPKLQLSIGQNEQIDRVYHSYPDLHDDEFVKENIKYWLKD